MRLGFVYDAMVPWETGGVQTRVWELGRRLADDHDVHWFGLKYWDGPATTTREGVTLHGVAEPPDLYVGDRRSITEALSFTARLTPTLLRADLDVVDCQEFPYFPAFPSKAHALATGSTMVFTWHEVWGDYWYEYLGRKGVFGTVVERVTARLPDAHVAVSERTRRDAAGIGAADPTIVPNGVDIDGIADVPSAERPVDVLYVGRLIPEKGADLLVDAVAHLVDDRPDLDCLIVGEGPSEGAVQDAIADAALEDTIEVRGFLEAHEDVLGLMKAADVLALPSRREGFGITALEALACGTPVVTIAHPQNAARELVDDGNTGAVCAPTASAVAAGIDRATGLAAGACVAAAAPYDWDRIADRMEAAYREVA